jgi:polyvinyl alcohol dehydrogenase (cytochrome)
LGRIGAVIVTLLLASAPALAAPTVDWPFAGNGTDDNRSQPAESQISTANVGQLHPKWIFTTGGDVSATPTVFNGVVYAVDWGGNLFAINASNGHAVWSHKISEYNGVVGSMSRTSVAVDGGTLYLGDMPSTPTWPTGVGAHVIAVDAATGNLKWMTQIDDHPASRITSSPVVANGAVYLGVSSDEENLATDPHYKCCTFRGSAVGLDASTGHLLWKTFTVPVNFPGGAVWSSTPAVDGGSVYFTTGNNYNVPPSVHNGAKQGKQNCLPANDNIDSILSLDRASGAIKWSSRHSTYDAWTVACLTNPPGPNCPSPSGADFDFGSGANLFTAGGHQLVGAGQKSGMYWALDRSTGNVVWNTQVGPGGVAGGVEWGTATDGQRVYVEIANSSHQSYPLLSGQTTTGGAWSGLDAATGEILWQTADPIPSEDMGPPTVANGVVYVGSFDPQGHMYAMDAASGHILFSVASGGSVIDAPSVANGTVYWGSGYAHLPPGTPNNKLYAFKLP